MKARFVLCLAAGLALSMVSMAQTKTTFGVRAGVNFTNLNGESDGDDVNGKIKTGFNAGFNAEIPVGIDFYIQPGLIFSTKGAKDEDVDYTINLSYVELPINFLYKPELGMGKLLLGFGPYFAMAAGGSIKPDGGGDDVDIKFKSKITPAEYLSDVYLKRFDAGGNLLVGYEFANKFSFQLNAQLGLVKINPKIDGVDNDDKLKNTGFGVSLGYRF